LLRREPWPTSADRVHDRLCGVELSGAGTFIEPGGLSAYYVMQGLASGIGAHMLSPIHTCLVMTLHYYEAGMGKTYHLLFMPTAVVFFTGGCVFAAANWLAG